MNHSDAETISSSTTPQASLPRGFRWPWTLLALLVSVNLVNYLDRQLIFPLFPYLKDEFGLTDFRLGLLGTVFIVVHALASLPFGWLADRWRRRRIIGFGVLFWSGATVLTGLAQSFRMLLISRSLVGVGESAYAPAGTAMLSDAFPVSLRARVQSVFTLGMFFGGIAGMMLSGTLAARFGWRPAFFIVAVPGMILAFFCFRIREPERRHKARAGGGGVLLANPAFFLTLVSAALVTFAASAFVTWAVTFAVRYHGLTVKQASLILGPISMGGGLLGVSFGGWLADKLQSKFPGGRALVIAVGFLASAPLLYVGIRSETPMTFYVAIALATFFLTWYHGPATAIVHDLAPVELRAAAFGLYMLFIHLVGNAPAPTVIGALADRTSLRTAMMLPVATLFLSALGFLGVGHLIYGRTKKG